MDRRDSQYPGLAAVVRGADPDSAARREVTVELVEPAPRGLPLRTVTYEGFDWDDSFATAGFTQVSIAVLLLFGDDIPYALRWRLREPYECLTSRGWTEEDPSPATRRVDASQHWAHLLGARVTAQQVAVLDTMWGPQPWSTRLDFDTGDALVVCLGELTARGAPTYLPASRLGTGSRAHATAYRPSLAFPSAWTDG
jgi:hypothetical protein